MSAEQVRNYYRKQGAVAERERIIAIIEEHIAYAVKKDDEMHGQDDIFEPEDIIALINGEE